MKRELGLAALLYAALALVLTWPLAARLTSAVPIGGDNLHLAWALAWIARAAALDPMAIFDGNIFHPAAKTIALSDPNVSSALLVAPAWWLFGEPGLLVNLLFLASFVLCGVAAQALGREWGASPLGGLAAGLLFAFSPLRFSHVDHVQLYAFWWTPLALLALDRFFRTGRTSPLAAATICLVAQAYASLYLAAFALAAVALLALFAVASGRVRPPWRTVAAKLAFAVAAAVVLCLPLAFAYAEIRLTWGATRSLEQNVRFAASPAAFLSVPEASLVWGRALARFEDPVAPWEKQLFPGLAALVLAAAALVRERRSLSTRFGLALALASFVCALGPVLVWGGRRTGIVLPYLVAWQWLPPLQGLRGPARWALLGSLGVALAGGAGASRLPRAAAGILLSFAVLEAWVVPLPTTAVPTGDRRALDERLAASRHGAVLELPLPPSGDEQYEREPVRIYRSAFHWRRIVNGYSGYTPASYGLLRDVVATETPERVLPILAAWDVRTIVLHKREMAPDALAAWQALPALRPAYEDEGALVLEHDVPPPAFRRLAARPAQPTALVPGEWSPSKIAFGAGDPPLALPPRTFGWHRGRARWTSAAGTTTEDAAKYFCPPIVRPSLAWRTVYLVAPTAPGSYRVRLEGECFEIDETVVVGSAAR